MAGMNDLEKNSHLKKIQNLNLPLTSLRGVGPKRAALLSAKGLNSLIDLFYFMPFRYEDRTKISPIGRTEHGLPALVRGRVVKGKEEKFYPSRKRLFRIIIRDDEDELDLLWFRYRKPHLAGFAGKETQLTAYGTVRIDRGKRMMIHPDVRVSEAQGPGDQPGFLPVYSSVEGISGNTLRSIIKDAIDNYSERIIDPLPKELLTRLELPGLRRSIENVHFPSHESTADSLNRADSPWHRRLLFDRFFYVMLTIAFRKMLRESESTPASLIPRGLIGDMERFFRFRLTSDQLRAINEIKDDLEGSRPMNRLLMGDVGTGKTAVAAAAAYILVRNNRQAAIMTPTQVLADQHMAYFSGLPEEMRFRPALLTGGLRKSERKELYDGIRAGQYNLIIGTHSLIQGGLAFRDLGIVIIDEQHRFGVRQRAQMDKKGHNPHILVMTATPIPRTLAIAFYGDMDISMIREYPKGRRHAATFLVEGDRKRWVFELLRSRLAEGQQGFVICPVIQESDEMNLKGAEEMAKSLRKLLSPGFRVEMIHGRQLPEERERIMRDFHKGLIDLLVGTTVIEVGVHVSNATVMVIEHPERFGLAQLHQLRGRVGRGTEEGVCILMLSDNLSEAALSRLRILAESHDGFEIAQRDLELRGHGELTGIRQSGIGELEISEMVRHRDLLEMAKQEAQDLLESDPDLSHPDHRYLKIMMESISGTSLDL